MSIIKYVLLVATLLFFDQVLAMDPPPPDSIQDPSRIFMPRLLKKIRESKYVTKIGSAETRLDGANQTLTLVFDCIDPNIKEADKKRFVSFISSEIKSMVSRKMIPGIKYQIDFSYNKLQVSSIELLDRFAEALSPFCPELLETYKLNHEWDQEKKLTFLRSEFQRIVFANILGPLFPDFKDVRNPLVACANTYTAMPEYFLNINNEYNNIRNTSFEKLARRINVYSPPLSREIKDNSDISFDIGSILENLHNLAPFDHWVAQQAVRQFLQDAIEEFENLGKSLADLQEKVLRFARVNQAIQKIFNDIEEEDRYKLAFSKYFSQSEKINILFFGIDTFSKAIKEKIKEFNGLLSMIDVNDTFQMMLCGCNCKPAPSAHPAQKRLPKKNEIPVETKGVPFIEEAPIESTTTSFNKECRDRAREENAKQEARAAKRDSRVQESTTTTNTQTHENTSKCTNKFLLTNHKTRASFDLEVNFLIENSNVYIGFHAEDPSNEMSDFLETGKRLKMLTRDSLGQNGIKHYGPFLIVKNKKHVENHLVFLCHPINQGQSGHIYIPYKIMSHRAYEKLLDEEVLLHEILIREQKAISVSRAS